MMRRSHRNALILLLVVLAAAVVWAFQNQPVWLPGTSAWVQKTWRGLIRPDASSRTTVGSQPAAASRSGSGSGEQSAQPVSHRPRKCTTSAGHVTYTNQSCPPGAQEQWFDDSNGAVVQSAPGAGSSARK